MYPLILLAYTIVLLLIGFLRSGGSTEKFFFADRNLGAFWISITLTASWIGAASTLVTIREAASSGYSALWVMAVPTITTLIVFFLITGIIRRRRFSTLPGLLRQCYGPGVTAAAAWLIFAYMILLTSSQLVAWGKLLSSMVSLPYSVSILCAVLLVTAYSTMGGFRSVVFTDGIQALLLGGAILVIYLFLGRSPSHNPVSAFVSSFGKDLSHYSLLVASFTLAWVISPIVWQRIAAAKSAHAARKGIFFAAAFILGLYMMIIPVGIAMKPTDSLAGDIIRNLIAHLPAWTGGIVFIGLGSAILSTADTALNLAAMTFSMDMNPARSRDGGSPLRTARIGTIFSAALAALIAIRIPSILKTLGLASEIMAEGLFIPGIYALFSSKPSPKAGLLAVCMGGGFALLSFTNSLGLALPIPQWPASLPWGLGLSLAGFLLGAFLDSRKPGFLRKSD